MGILGESEKRVYDPIVNSRVDYPHSDSGTETIDAPRGLGIVSFRAIEQVSYGRCGYNFSLIGDDSLFVNDVIINSKFREVFDAIDSSVEDSKKDEVKRRVEQLKEEARHLSQVTASTNSKLLCHWRVKHHGNEFNRRGGHLRLAVEVEFVRGLGTYNIDSVIANIIAAIRGGTAPAGLALMGHSSITLSVLGSRRVALQAYDGRHFICAEGGGGSAVVADRTAINEWESFNLVDLGSNRVALQAHNGQFVCAEGGGGGAVVANREAADVWEILTVVQQIGRGPNKVALQAYDGRHFICAEGGGGSTVVADRTAVGDWETFELIEL